MALDTLSFGFQSSGSGGGGGTNTNIANTNLTQDADRTLETDGNSLSFLASSNALMVIEEDNITIGGGGSIQEVNLKFGTNAPALQIYEASGSGTNYVKLTCGALAANRTLTMPDATGTIALTSDIAVLTAGNGLTITGTEIDLDASLTTVTSMKNTSLVVGRDADNDIDFSTDNEINFRVGGNDEVVFDTNGIRPSANGGYNLGDGAKRFDEVHINQLIFKTTGSTVGDAQGDVLRLGTTSVQAGKVYYWDGTDWQQADANAVSTGTGLLGVAMDTGNANVVGILVRGFVTLGATTGGSDGDVLYVDTNASRLTSTAPSGSGDIVRVAGYLISSTNNSVWFQPDGTWVEVA